MFTISRIFSKPILFASSQGNYIRKPKSPGLDAGNLSITRELLYQASVESLNVIFPSPKASDQAKIFKINPFHSVFQIFFLAYCSASAFFGRKLYLSRIQAWQMLLKLVKPKVVIAIQPRPDLCVACSNLGIDIYDFQHGVICDSDSYYSPIFNNPDLHSDRVKSIPSGLIYQYKPTYIQFQSHKHLKHFYLGCTLLAKHILTSSQDSFNLQSPIDILFTHQHGFRSVWGKSKHFYPEEHWYPCGIPRVLFDLLSVVNLKIRLVIRLHPSENASTIIQQVQNIISILPQDLRMRTKLSLPERSSLFEDISRSFCHITSHSAVVFECAELGIHSLLLSPEHMYGKSFDYFANPDVVTFSECDLYFMEQWVINQTTAIQSLNQIRKNYVNEFTAKLKTFSNLYGIST